MKINLVLFTFIGSIILSSMSYADTVNKSRKEFFNYLGITNGQTHAYGYSYGVCVNVASNQYVEIITQAEFTTPYTGKDKNVGLGWNIVRYNADKIEINITPPVMQNITPDMHHMVINPHGVDTSMQPGLNCYYLRNWAVSASVAGGNLQLEKGYGEIIAIVRNK